MIYLCLRPTAKQNKGILIMKYALVNSDRQEAEPNLFGLCQGCNLPVIAKCGKVNIWHWAHYKKRMCDQWWENETEWHRAWKRLFLKECQEIIQYAENGEKHIADIKTNEGYVIEFQHSLLRSEERQAREDFYKKMIWVIDGTRRLRDKNKFIHIIERSKRVDMGMLELPSDFDQCALLRDWVGSIVPVFCDFSEDILWVIWPKTIEKKVYIFKIERNKLISSFQEDNLEALLKCLTSSVARHEFYLNRMNNKMNPLDRILQQRRR